MEKIYFNCHGKKLYATYVITYHIRSSEPYYDELTVYFPDNRKVPYLFSQYMRSKGLYKLVRDYNESYSVTFSI